MKTAYSKGDVAALRQRIATGRTALRAMMPPAPMGTITLVCGCSNCIDEDVYLHLRHTPMRALTRRQISQYFGGAGVLGEDTSPEARTEAFGIYLHVLDALAEAMLADRQAEGHYKRAWGFVEPEYWHEPLYGTGFIDGLPPPHREAITDVLIDLVDLGLARNSPRMNDALIFLSRGTDAFGAVVEGIMTGPPRRHLGFWVAVAGWSPNSPAGMRNAAVSNFSSTFRFMDADDRQQLEKALADGCVEALLERYAFAAKDAEWFGYLSRLVAWRENTVRNNEAQRRRGIQGW